MQNTELWNEQKLNFSKTLPYAGSAAVYLHYSPCRATCSKAIIMYLI